MARNPCDLQGPRKNLTGQSRACSALQGGSACNVPGSRFKVTTMQIDYDKELFVDSHIMTYTGVYFDAFNPDPEKIRIEDIAHALSQQPRYAGHLPIFYSVAQHSIYVARLLPPWLKAAGLLHDAAEAYLCDVPAPFKKYIPGYKKAEKDLLTAILQKFGLGDKYVAGLNLIKEADTEALKLEWDVIMKGRPNRDRGRFVFGWPEMEQVETTFIQLFKLYARSAL